MPINSRPMSMLLKQPALLVLLMSTALTQPAMAQGLTGNAEADAMIASIGKAAACALLQQAASGAGEMGGALAGALGGLCKDLQMPKKFDTSVPITSAKPGNGESGGGGATQAMIGQIAGDFVSQILEKAMSGGGGGGGGDGGGNAGGDNPLADPRNDTAVAGLPIIMGGTFSTTNQPNLTPLSPQPREPVADNPFNPRPPLVTTLVANNPSRTPENIPFNTFVNSPITALRQVVVDTDWQTREGGVRAADGSLLGSSGGVSIGAFGEGGNGGVMLASAGGGGLGGSEEVSGGVNSSAAAPMSANINPMLDMFNQGYADARAGQAMNKVFADDADYKLGYAQGRLAVSRAAVV